MLVVWDFSDNLNLKKVNSWKLVVPLYFISNTESALNQITELDIEEKYSNLYDISSLTVSTSNVLNRFKAINQRKAWSEPIKPFNFFNVGFQTIEEDGNAVKPLAPFSKDPQKIVYNPFIDYQRGEVKEGSHYFKPLSRTILQYVDHPENKFEGDIGVLKRKHIHVDGVVYIGKEANNIDEQALKVKKVQVFLDKDEIMQKILDLPQKIASEFGVRRNTFQGVKELRREFGKIGI